MLNFFGKFFAFFMQNIMVGSLIESLVTSPFKKLQLNKVQQKSLISINTVLVNELLNK